MIETQAGPPVAAVINSSPDVVDMLRIALERAGIVVVSAFTHEIREGVVDLARFVEQHDPRVILYDIAPPYDANWQLFLHIAQQPSIRGRSFVLTTANARHVTALAGRDRRIYEIVGRPFDLDEIVQATREAIRSRALQ